MSYRAGQSLFFLATALFCVTAALFLFHDAGTAAYPYSLDNGEQVPPRARPPLPPAEPELLFYPRDPAPGDFLVVEAGPFPSGDPVDFSFDFPGAVSDHFRVGGLIYAIVAVSYETEPGLYQLEVQSGQEPQKAQALKKEIAIRAKEFRLSRFSMPADRTAGWTAARLAEDREKVRRARATTEAHPLWYQTFINPLEGRVTSEYGAIRIINNNPPRRHTGIDIGADEGTEIFAPNNGIVRLAEFLLSGGNTVIIDHGLNLSSTYMHLHEIAVEEGQAVRRGDMIGTVGMTGYATGPHLHWEVNIGQVPVNPVQLLANELLWIAPAYSGHYYREP